MFNWSTSLVHFWPPPQFLILATPMVKQTPDKPYPVSPVSLSPTYRPSVAGYRSTPPNRNPNSTPILTPT